MSWGNGGECLPNCVPEYYRELQEREDRESEELHQMMDWFEGNKKRNTEIIKEGVRVMTLEKCCYRCPFGTELLPESDDDLPTAVCGKRLCIVYGWDRIKSMVLSPYYFLWFRLYLLKLSIKKRKKKESWDDFES